MNPNSCRNRKKVGIKIMEHVFHEASKHFRRTGCLMSSDIIAFSQTYFLYNSVILELFGEQAMKAFAML